MGLDPQRGGVVLVEGQLYVSVLLRPPRLQLLEEEMIWGRQRGPGRLNKPPLPGAGAPTSPCLLGKKIFLAICHPLLHVCLSVHIIGAVCSCRFLL